MTTAQTTPYGSWKSPITSDLIVSASIGLGQLGLDGRNVYWTESRPTEGGRNVVVQLHSDGRLIDRTPEPYNARTRVHEYGGGAFLVNQGTLYFSNFSDQRVYRQHGDHAPEALTPDFSMRFADSIMDERRNRIICVREDHTNAKGAVTNTIATIDLLIGDTSVLVSGNDFYSTPRLSPDGSQLAWLTWHHPNMPWDGTELWLADIRSDGELDNLIQVAGSGSESIFQPAWSPSGRLHFISDRTGWWNLYRTNGNMIEPLYPEEAEFGHAQWMFGMSAYAFITDEQLICSYSQHGTWHLASLDTQTGQLSDIETPYSEISALHATSETVIFQAGSPTQSSAIVQLDLSTYLLTTLRRSNDLNIDENYVSTPKAISCPTSQGRTAHALFYPPKNPDHQAPCEERPPLIVKSHGGPTSTTSTTLNLRIQYWTSRGFAVLDVNYGGSTGYGRPYRERLKQQWGIVDVDDCVNSARFLVEQGEVDSTRLVITGGSAGGYTTLCALTYHEVFHAGASHYGICDLEVLAQDTHKFESRYLDSLVGPYPEQQSVYRERSPIHFTDQLSCPLILFQGLEDQVVRPNQAETMVNALRQKGVPVAYMPFAGEQHGFRRAENIKRVLDSELDFYARIFGFALAEPVDPVLIENHPNK